MQKFIPLIGRIFLALIFLISGFGKIADFNGTQQYMVSQGMPMTGLLLVFAIIFELGGGLSIITGFKARWGAGALIVFLVLATAVFHLDLADRMQMTQFLKNLSMIGGLLLVVGFGSGPYSLDNKSK